MELDQSEWFLFEVVVAIVLLGLFLRGKQSKKVLDRHHGHLGLALGSLLILPELDFFCSFRLLFHYFTSRIQNMVSDEGIKKALAHILLWGRALEISLAARGATPVSPAI